MANGSLVLLIENAGGTVSQKSALALLKRRIRSLADLGFDIRLEIGPAFLPGQNLPTQPNTVESGTSNAASNTSAAPPSQPSPAASTLPEPSSPEDALKGRMMQASVEADAAAANAREMEEIGQPEMYGHPGTVERELPDVSARERPTDWNPVTGADPERPAETKRSKGGRRSYS